MKGLFQWFKSENGKAGGAPTEPRLTLAAFGKHPGWDDHIPGIGVETEALAYAMQSLYVGGIGGQIDAGVWEKLDPAKRVAGYDHTFLWFRSGHLLLGRFWSSTDGKGRTKYPMVLCLDGEGVSPAFLVQTLLPGLERLREACQAARTADQVTSHCRAAQEQLRAVLRQTGAGAAQGLPSSVDKQNFVRQTELGPNRLGLLRVLHDLGTVPFLAANARGAAPGTPDSVRSHALRVPVAAFSPNQALLLWATFLRCVLPPSAPLLLLARAGAPWVDLLVGQPASDDFFCLQASLSALPLTTQIPYELARDLPQRLQSVEARFLETQPPGPGPVLPPAGTSSAEPPPPLAPSTATASRGLKLPLLLGVLVLALIGGAAVWWLGGGRPAERTPPVTAKPPAALPQPSQAAQPVPPKPTPAGQEQQFRTSTNAATLALARQDYAEAQRQAVAALEIKPNDPAALKLKAEAQRGLDAAAAAAQRERDFQAAMSAAQSAFDRKDYATATIQAQAALLLKPADASALELKSKTQTAAAAAAAAAAVERDYQAAVAAARTALETKNFSSALTQADLALRLKPGDQPAQQLKDQAQEQARAPAVTAPAPATNAASAAGAALAKAPFTNSLGMEFVWLAVLSPGGGWLGRHEVTQKQYQTIMGKLPEGQGASGDNLPVANVPFKDAQEFCTRLSQREQKTYALPARQEWLAVAGLSESQVDNPWAVITNRLKNEVTSIGQSKTLSHPEAVGSHGPQTNGICDLLGNVREWVVGATGGESAGLCYQSAFGRGKELFPSLAVTLTQQETGFRCVMRGSP